MKSIFKPVHGIPTKFWLSGVRRLLSNINVTALVGLESSAKITGIRESIEEFAREVGGYAFFAKRFSKLIEEIPELGSMVNRRKGFLFTSNETFPTQFDINNPRHMGFYNALAHETGHALIATNRLQIPDSFFKKNKAAIENIAREYFQFVPRGFKKAAEELFVETAARKSVLSINPKITENRLFKAHHGYGVSDQMALDIGADVDYQNLLRPWSKTDRTAKAKEIMLERITPRLDKARQDIAYTEALLKNMVPLPDWVDEWRVKSAAAVKYLQERAETLKAGLRSANHSENVHGAIQGMMPDRPDFKGARTPGNPDSSSVIDSVKRFFVGDRSIDVGSMNKSVHELADDVLVQASKKAKKASKEALGLYSMAPGGVKSAVKVGGVLAVGVGALSLIRGMFERERDAQPVSFDATQLINAKKDPGRYYPTKSR